MRFVLQNVKLRKALCIYDIVTDLLNDVNELRKELADIFGKEKYCKMSVSE